MNTVRLDRLLANLGYGSRREVGAIIAAGRVALDGVAIRRGEQQVALDAARAGALTVDAAALEPLAPLTIMLHKPAGYTCSHDERGPLVYDLLPPRWKDRRPALAAAGRLDKESTGQLILTDDGDLLHRIIHPKRHAPKYYAVALEHPLRGDEAAQFAGGTFLLDHDPKPLKPAFWTPDGPRNGSMLLHEGRFHQIRRMFEVLGNHVVALHRFRTGDLPLGDLPVGDYRHLSTHDLTLLTATSPAKAPEIGRDDAARGSGERGARQS